MSTGYRYWEAEDNEVANREALKGLEGAYEPAEPLKGASIGLRPAEEMLAPEDAKETSKLLEDHFKPLEGADSDPGSCFGAVCLLKRVRGRILAGVEDQSIGFAPPSMIEAHLNIAHVITSLIARIRKEEPR